MQMCASACAIGRSVERGILGMETKPGNPTHISTEQNLGGHPDAELCNNCTSLVKHFFRTCGLAQLTPSPGAPAGLANSQIPAPVAALRHSVFIFVCTIVATYNSRFVGTGSGHGVGPRHGNRDIPLLPSCNPCQRSPYLTTELQWQHTWHLLPSRYTPAGGLPAIALLPYYNPAYASCCAARTVLCPTQSVPNSHGPQPAASHFAELPRARSGIAW